MSEVTLSDVIDDWKAKVGMLALALEGAFYASDEAPLAPELLHEASVVAKGVHEDMVRLEAFTTGLDLIDIYWDRETDRLIYRKSETEVPNRADQENR